MPDVKPWQLTVSEFMAIMLAIAILSAAFGMGWRASRKAFAPNSSFRTNGP
jgi:hypothetical protein